MSFLEALLGLPEEVITGLLLVAIILAVVLAFKIMEMVFETITIAALSGVFYTAMTVLFEGASFAFNDLLLFSFLGASLYMLYGFLMTAFTAAEKIITLPVKMILLVYRPIRSVLGKGYRSFKRKLKRMNETEIKEKSSKNKSTKEVVLND